MTTKSVKFLAAAVQREMMPQMTIAPGRNSAGLPTLLRNKLLGTCMRMYLQVTISWFCSRGLTYPMLASQCDSYVLLVKPKGRAPGLYLPNEQNADAGLVLRISESQVLFETRRSGYPRCGDVVPVQIVQDVHDDHWRQQSRINLSAKLLLAYCSFFRTHGLHQRRWHETTRLLVVHIICFVQVLDSIRLIGRIARYPVASRLVSASRHLGLL